MGWLLVGIGIFLLMQGAGPLLSIYTYDFKEDGLRISARFLGFIPMPGTTFSYNGIYDIRRLDGKSHWLAFAVIPLIEMFADTPGGYFFRGWGNIWKQKNSVFFSYEYPQKRSYGWDWKSFFSLSSGCTMCVVTPEHPDRFIMTLNDAILHSP